MKRLSFLMFLLSGCLHTPGEIKAKPLAASYEYSGDATAFANCIAARYDEINTVLNAVIRTGAEEIDVQLKGENFTASVLSIHKHKRADLFVMDLNASRWVNEADKAILACGGRKP